MNYKSLATVGVLALAATATSPAASKTTQSEKVDPKNIGSAPYRFNGVVLTDVARGSGFCAVDNRLFFSAAHVVFDGTSWEAPPTWYPQANSQALKPSNGIATRGYLRWANYADVANGSQSGDPLGFSRDVIVGFAFKDLIKGPPAKVDYDGKKQLTEGSLCMITGYPAKNFYLDQNIEGYFMHRTPPKWVEFGNYQGNAVQDTLITTGPGNSGGPVWTGSNRTGWKAAGVLVGGRPSETIIYAFTGSTKTLVDSAEKALEGKSFGSLKERGLGADTLFFENNTRTEIPDGVHTWKNLGISVGSFDRNSTVTKVSLSLSISTTHRGDLAIALTSPEGYEALVHNEGGADADNLNIKDMDLTAYFTGVKSNGRWTVRIQDRLKGDKAVFKAARLVVEAKAGTAVTP